MTFGTVIRLALVGALFWVLAARWMVVDSALPAAPVRAILLDVSPSVTRVSPGFSRRVRERLEIEAEQAQAAEERLLVVVAGSAVRRAFGPGDPREFRAQLRGESGRPFDPLAGGDAGNRSELARGVRLVGQLLAGSACERATLLVMGDGSFTGASPITALRKLIAAGVQWRGTEAVDPELTDVSLSELQLVRNPEPGAPLVGSLRLHVREGTTGARVWDRIEISAEISTEDETGRRTQTLDLWQRRPRAKDSSPLISRTPSWTAVCNFSLGPVQRGRTVVEVRLRAAPGETDFDPIPENDRLRGVVTAGAGRVIGWLSAPEHRATLSDYFESLAPGLIPLALTPGDVAASLPELDALVVIDLPLEELPSELCRSFVHAGGGLLVAGGWRFLAGWSADPEPGSLTEILPLQPSSGAADPRQVLVLVDGSGSMAGKPFELVRSAVRELVSAAPAQDEVGLSFFTGALFPRSLLRGRTDGVASAAERQRAAERLLEQRVPGGPTQILDSLEQLLVRREAQEERALVFLLTDGREQSDVFDAESRAQRLRRQLPASNTKLVVFAVGEDADLEFLKTLVSDSADLHAADSLGELGELFRREVNRERVREAPAIQLSSHAGPLAREVFPAAIAPAPLTRLLRTELSGNAELILSSDEGEPVLACERVGRGRTAVLASLPLGDWGAAWASRLADLTPLLRWCARRTDDRPPLALELRQRELVISGVDPKTPILIHGHIRSPMLDRAATVAGEAPDSTLLFSLPTDASGAARLDVRRASLPTWLENRDAGVLALELRAPDGGTLFSLPLISARAPEFVEPRSTWSLPVPDGAAPSGSASITRFGGGPDSANAAADREAALWLLAAGAISVAGAGFGLSRGRRAARGAWRTDRG